MPASSVRGALALYAATIGLSALLLFSVQPMIAKMALPVLGGAPATWAVSLCFFQAVLLLGYAYAHLIGTRLPQAGALAVHLALLIVAFATLPIALSTRLGAPPAEAYLWLMGLLALSVGLPFFALSVHAPLLQAWFAGLGHGRSSNPYFLYAASNAGSLGALLAYPTLIEPLMPLSAQSRAWTAGFVLLAILVAGCGWMHWRHGPTGMAAARAVDPGRATVVGWRDRSTWIALAFVPSGLLVAFTTFLTTDLASAPLLWVIPLALYLATFIAAFRDPPMGARSALALQPAAVAAVLVAGEWTGAPSWLVAALAGLLAFAATSLVCHAELYRQRPAAEQLTDFYLCLSLGGVLGGVFAALMAPFLFTSVLEFPLLLGAGLACRPDVWRASATARTWLMPVLAVAAAVGLAWLAGRTLRAEWLGISPGARLGILAAVGIAAAAARPPWLKLALGALLIAAVTVLPSTSAPVHVVRTFFGTHKVVDTGGGTYRLLMHGTTLHGLQRVSESGRPTPLGYYHPTGPLAGGIALARTAAGASGAQLRLGVVGLGTGALACYARPGDRWRFFELDPEVARIASDPAYFTYLSKCLPGADIVLGDARLTLAREETGSFDVLVIDAFSSDAIPVHLLTVEALRLYESLLAPAGVLLLHISNQNLDLPPVVEANIAAVPGLRGVYAEGERRGEALASQVVLAARTETILAPALQFPKARVLAAGTVRAWTDDYSDLLTAVVRRYRAKLTMPLL